MRSLRMTSIVSVFCLLTVLVPAAWAQDPFPVYAVTFFNLEGCPLGWEPLNEAYERFLVPMADFIGTQVPPHPAPQMGSHWHRFTSSVTLPPLSYALVAGCSENCVSVAGSHPIAGETIHESNLPFVRLFACIKTDEDVAGTVPPGLMSYFFRPRGCPKRWSEVTEAWGRFLVGLPGQGTPGAAFGGSRLGPGETRKHTHQVLGSLTTRIQEVAAASVGLADGYGLHGTYSFAGTTEESSYDNWRYLQLLLCRKDP